MKQLYIIISLLFISSCNTGPKPINYGEDACDFCQMTIVDKQHAAQLVTEKGRVYKYDAIECMMNALKKWERPPVEIYLVADYANPGSLIPASAAHFLISEEIPSPMGANLSAFSQEREVNVVHARVNGDLLTWKQLQMKFELAEK